MKDIPFEWIQYLVNTGLGFLVLAGMLTLGIVAWLKRRNGKSNGTLALVPDQAHSPAVLYHMMAQMLDEVKDFRDEQRYLSARLGELQEENREGIRDNRLMHSGHERAGRKRYLLEKRRDEDHLEAMLAAVETVRLEAQKRMSA